MRDVNIVIGGTFQGEDVRWDENNHVYLSTYGSDRKYFDKSNVKEVEKINEEASDYKDRMGLLFGSVYAAGLSDVKDVIVKIKWSWNSESLLKVRESVYTYILSTAMENKIIYEPPRKLTPEERIRIMNEETQRKKEETQRMNEMAKENLKEHPILIPLCWVAIIALIALAVFLIKSLLAELA